MFPNNLVSNVVAVGFLSALVCFQKNLPINAAYYLLPQAMLHTGLTPRKEGPIILVV